VLQESITHKIVDELVSIVEAGQTMYGYSVYRSTLQEQIIENSMLWIVKTIYDMIYNYATGINLLAVLVFTAAINCIALFSFLTYNNQTLKELERVCKLTKIAFKKVERIENEQ